jgi:flagella basal body P-ring formation protein FlgA
MSNRWGMTSLLLFACVAQAADAPAWVQTAQHELEQRLQAAYADVTSWTLTPVLSERQMDATSGEAAIRAAVMKLGKRSAMQVAWRDGDRQVRQTLWFSVSGEQPAVVVTADVPRHEALRGEIVRSEQNAAWDPECDIVTSPAALHGMRARKALRAGALLCEQDVEPKPLVARGQTVTVRSRAGLVTVMLAGIAERDGNMGDRLPVRNPTSGELYMAAVAAEGEVVVRQ